MTKQTTQDIIRELTATARAHKLGWDFKRSREGWSVVDFRGKSIWNGSLTDARRLAAGRAVLWRSW
jgi:hypothetical protein